MVGVGSGQLSAVGDRGQQLLPWQGRFAPSWGLRSGLWKGCCRLLLSATLPHRHWWWCQGQSALTTWLWGVRSGVCKGVLKGMEAQAVFTLIVPERQKGLRNRQTPQANYWLCSWCGQQGFSFYMITGCSMRTEDCLAEVVSTEVQKSIFANRLDNPVMRVSNYEWFSEISGKVWSKAEFPSTEEDQVRKHLNNWTHRFMGHNELHPHVLRELAIVIVRPLNH